MNFYIFPFFTDNKIKMAKNSIKILLAEDALFLAEMLCKVLFKTEMNVIGVAYDGLELLSQVKKLKPDIILLDLVLPGVNGVELIKRIKSAFPDIQIIACSSLKDEHIILQAQLAGASDFIAKPFYSEKLLKSLRNAASKMEMKEAV